MLLVVDMRHGLAAKSLEVEFLNSGVGVMLLSLEEIQCVGTVSVVFLCDFLVFDKEREMLKMVKCALIYFSN